jgi:hypothetical protein
LIPTFLTIGYGDRKGYEGTDPEQRNKAPAHDTWLASRGAVIGAVGTPTQVRNPGGAGVSTTNGAYMQTELPIAGFALLEAATIDEAVDLVAGTPCAVAHGVVEVWPIVKAGDEDNV